MSRKKLNIPDDLKRRIKAQGYGHIIAIYDNGGKTLDRYIVYLGLTEEALYLPARSMKHKTCRAPLIELDQSQNISDCLEYLTKRAEIAIEGDRGGRTTYEIAGDVRDYGVSEVKALELMLDNWNGRCEPPWPPEDLAHKINNAYKYAQNVVGEKSAENEFSPVGPEILPDKNPNLSRALHYAALGWKLFPAKWKKGKGQHIGLIKWGLHATDDPLTIRDWADRWKNCYFCVSAQKSNITIIDIDNKKGAVGDATLFDLEIDHGELPSTIKVKTPSNGYHYIFKGKSPVTVGRLGKGIDTPVMIPLPGTSVKGKGYYRLLSDKKLSPVDLPQWLKKILGEPTVKSNEERLTMSHDATSPQGVCMWSAGHTGRHNGKSITFDDLPEECKQAIDNQFREEE